MKMCHTKKLGAVAKAKMYSLNYIYYKNQKVKIN